MSKIGGKLILTDAHMENPRWSAESLKAQRRKYGISQEEIAKEAEVTQGLISQIEKGTTRMLRDTANALWNALFSILDERYAQQIAAARERALALRGTPEGEAEAKKAGEWFEGLYATGGTMGWLQAGEKESMEKIIAGQDKVIESLKAQLAAQQEVNNWQPALIELSEKVAKQQETVDMLVKLLNVEASAGLASAEAGELREQIAMRFKSPGDKRKEIRPTLDKLNIPKSTTYYGDE